MKGKMVFQLSHDTRRLAFERQLQSDIGQVHVTGKSHRFTVCYADEIASPVMPVTFKVRVVLRHCKF